MALTGLDRVLLNLSQWEGKVEGAAETAMEELMRRLEDWAKTEHAWVTGRPHTEGTIQGLVTEVTSSLITGMLSADMDAGLWLELARGGKWAWLWPVIVNHQADIMQILSRAMVTEMTVIRNPDVDSEYEAAKAAWPRKRK